MVQRKIIINEITTNESTATGYQKRYHVDVVHKKGFKLRPCLFFTKKIRTQN